MKQYYNGQHSRRSSTVSEDDHTIITDDNFKVTEKSSDLAQMAKDEFLKKMMDFRKDEIEQPENSDDEADTI